MMDRRDFTMTALAACGGWWSSRNGQEQEQSSQQQTDSSFAKSYGELAPDSVTKKHIRRYVRDTAPRVDIPPYTGLRYRDNVPDTLDIAERAKLGINALTGIADSNADYEIYWLVNFSLNPPRMAHDYNDWVQNVEGLMEALPLLRLATGSTLNDQVDPVWMAGILRSIGPDGLFYVPLKECPWTRINTPIAYLNPVWSPTGQNLTIDNSSIEQVANSGTCQRIIGTMTVYYLRDGNPMWKDAIEKMIRRLASTAVLQGDYAYLPSGSIEPGGKFGTSPMPSGYMAEEISARPIQGLAQYYKVTGYEPARELAAKLSRYVRFHSQYYEPDGTPIIGADERTWFKDYDPAFHDLEKLQYGGHGHAHGIGLLSVLEYSAAVSDPEGLAFVRTGYEWMKANGSPLVGFFPEFFMPGYSRSETCINADMVAMALKLSDAGAGDYWDDADRWVRNHFLESQLVDSEWVSRLAKRSPAKPLLPNETGDHVAERNTGAFAGWSAGNDWVVPSAQHENSIMHCCTGSACRTMYYVWQHILKFQDEILSVNLLLNRASACCDIYSYIPYEGRVDLKIKQLCRQIRVRMPQWVDGDSDQLSCAINGNQQSIKWHGRYLEIGPAKPRDRITVKFPISEQTVHDTIGGVAYRLEIRGSTVIAIDPPGRNGPLYERAYYRQPMRWRIVDRFVPESEIAW
jgi:hypothetical protein